MRDIVCGLMGIFEADYDNTYLELPNSMSRNKTTILDFLRDKLRSRIQG